MSKTTCLFSCVILAAAFVATPAHLAHAGGNSNLYAVLQYESFYSQPLPTTPQVTTTFAQATAYSFCPAEDIEVTLTNPSIFQEAMTESQSSPEPDGRRLFDYIVNGSTESALFATLPSGQYLFETFTPTDPFCADVNTFNQPFPAGGWPSAIPTFSPSALSIINNFNPTVANTLNFNSFTPFAGSTSAVTFVYILTESQSFAFDSTLSNTATTITIPANTLQPGTQYTIVLRFYSARDQTVNFHDHALVFGRSNFKSFTTQGSQPCPADVGVQGGNAGSDGLLDNNDFASFITLFFASDPRADLGSQGGIPGSDNLFDNNDFAAFITLFFTGCPS